MLVTRESRQPSAPSAASAGPVFHKKRRCLGRSSRHPQSQVRIGKWSMRGDTFAESHQSGNIDNSEVGWVVSHAFYVFLLLESSSTSAYQPCEASRLSESVHSTPHLARVTHANTFACGSRFALFASFLNRVILKGAFHVARVMFMA